MKRDKLQRFKQALFIVGLILMVSPPVAAQQVQNEDDGDGSGLPGPKSILMETCTVTVLNRTGFTQFDGSFIVSNVPAESGLLRARVTCRRGDGATIYAESGLFSPAPNGEVSLGFLALGTSVTTPPADALLLVASKSTLIAIGDTAQLTVTAIFDDGSQADVTGEPDTVYTTSNGNIATISNTGLVIAVSDGPVIVSASKDGVIATLLLQVTTSTFVDSDGDGMPDDYELANGLNPNDPADAALDPDGDDLTNLDEFTNGTNPQLADSDADGLADGEELVLGTNPIDPDTDGDGLSDGDEVNTVIIGSIQTIAGNRFPSYSGDGGAATVASLDLPWGIVFDSQGDLIFADRLNNAIRKIEVSTGIINTIAGTGFSGFSGDGGQATEANLDNPHGIAIDAADNVFIADERNHVIRKVEASTGLISTVVGNGTRGYTGDGGPATAATMHQPKDVEVDGLGNLFIADSINNVVRKVDAATGVITTVAGNGIRGYAGDGGPATGARLDRLGGLALDGLGNLYIADTQNNRIRKVDVSTGIINRVAGTGNFVFNGDGIPATSSNIWSPDDILVDALGDLYIADSGNQRIRRVSASTGLISTIVGSGSRGFSGDGGPATGAAMRGPRSLAFDPSGNLHFTDSGNDRIRRVDAVTGMITTVAGLVGFSGDGGPALEASLTSPSGLALDREGNIYLTDTDIHVLRKVEASTGNIITVAGNGIWEYSGDGGPATEAGLALPLGVDVDDAGDIYIADTFNNVIRKVDSATGTISTVAGDGFFGFGGDGGPAINANMDIPYDVSVDSEGGLYIADTGNDRIRKVDPFTEIISTIAGDGSRGLAGDGGPATLASLNGPQGVLLDSDGNIYIVDSFNNVVRKVDAATGIISRIAGDGIYSFSGDGGPAALASLANPWNAALDRQGNLFIVDEGNSIIRMVEAATSIISTIAGTPEVGGPGGDGGSATLAGLSIPTGVAIDLRGHLIIADTGNRRIRRVLLHTDPLNQDSDGDGLLDGDELQQGLNPLLVDSDGDGIPDGQ